eukprot:2198431-Rhodomonas_salina.1
MIGSQRCGYVWSGWACGSLLKSVVFLRAVAMMCVALSSWLCCARARFGAAVCVRLTSGSVRQKMHERFQFFYKGIPDETINIELVSLLRSPSFWGSQVS